MSEHSLPIAVVSEEEWQATIRYADEHACEFDGPSSADSTPPSDFGRMLFDLAVTMNRAARASLQQPPLP